MCKKCVYVSCRRSVSKLPCVGSGILPPVYHPNTPASLILSSVTGWLVQRVWRTCSSSSTDDGAPEEDDEIALSPAGHAFPRYPPALADNRWDFTLQIDGTMDTALRTYGTVKAIRCHDSPVKTQKASWPVGLRRARSYPWTR